MIVCDTSGVLAAIDSSQRKHDAARAAVEADAGPLFLSPFVLAELDYLLATRVGVQAEIALLRDVVRGSYRLAPFGSDDLERAVELVERYQDAAIGLADASVLVLAARHRTDRILTLDQRHFRAIPSHAGNLFTLLPLDP